MKAWTKPELSELSVEDTLVGLVVEFAESEPVGTDARGNPVLGAS
jgi:hypothetical protein